MTSTTGLQQIQDVCPAAGAPLCAPPSADVIDSDILSIPAYIVAVMATQANVTEWRMAGSACVSFFTNLQTPNLAATYSWGATGATQSGNWNFNSAKPTFVTIVSWCTLIAALPQQ